ncbi:MAG: hypothetical protein A2504_14405 [Bdellovibrionales bacterium RIFOXYD12_FULL_39_22]|nr:MAG: hypothetical protein A2385_04840 [Bdellovibrionales bacterium RIFOXYB1_FULL_39_21]OFZ43474.1 MAG: hypothetical protein A2485_13355 [Bdellovibrionales bacterium RIFOXYC12_FULL_39_17]OFZ47017.1 MAG: hypothetical protein A2404_00415 [Bdellovibrionales bacterium RIFOXYC1_FULL_39_130]OFZ73077.1 MAG: hypothetical protein A2451_08095 [Bdellovibrionales bacterium RIFOXYC2_FULL_39_8]OFZ76214.1 MAG: hypothetical protein A2560_07665 [Bdellovibrionales bacterium RIFOXYD1_FULL_39_84]OFZ94449.1 MAG:
MDRLFLALFLLTIFTYGFSMEHYNIDQKKSEVRWKGKKLTGEHYGTVKIKSGMVMYEGEKIDSGEVIIDMASILNQDLSDKTNNEKLVGHLKSDDFFSVDKFPEAKIILTKIKAVKGGYDARGDLTIKGTTSSLDFKIEESGTGANRLLKIKTQFDRSKYNVKYGSSKFFPSIGDKIIYDDVELDVILSLEK